MFFSCTLPPHERLGLIHKDHMHMKMTRMGMSTGIGRQGFAPHADNRAAPKN
jgi:hypothetical protein